MPIVKLRSSSFNLQKAKESHILVIANVKPQLSILMSYDLESIGKETPTPIFFFSNTSVVLHVY